MITGMKYYYDEKFLTAARLTLDKIPMLNDDVREEIIRHVNPIEHTGAHTYRFRTLKEMSVV